MMKNKLVLVSVLAILLISFSQAKADQFMNSGQMNPGRFQGQHSNGNFSHHDANFSGKVSPRRDFDRDAGKRADRNFGRDRSFHNRTVIIVSNPYYYRRAPVYTTPLYISGPLSVEDIVNMVFRGVPDDQIINEIQRSGSVFSLNTATVTYLREHNVSDRVIDFMLSSGSTASYGY